jgi:hypothetical protein
MLDLACEMRPCPLGATRHRKLLLSETRSAPRDSSDQDQTLPSLPYLTDQSTGVSLSGADAIVEYLYATYLDGEAPSPLVAPGFFASARAFRCLYHMSCVFLLLKKRGLFFFVSPSLFVSLI